jgi:hypothetical protein
VVRWPLLPVICIPFDIYSSFFASNPAACRTRHLFFRLSDVSSSRASTAAGIADALAISAAGSELERPISRRRGTSQWRPLLLLPRHQFRSANCTISSSLLDVDILNHFFCPAVCKTDGICCHAEGFLLALIDRRHRLARRNSRPSLRFPPPPILLSTAISTRPPIHLRRPLGADGQWPVVRRQMLVGIIAIKS